MNHKTIFESAKEMGDTIISQQRTIDALVAALEVCPLPSTMGNVETHYRLFYDWYNNHVDAALALARKEAT